MLYLVIKGTGCKGFNDLPYELGDFCEAMHEMTDGNINMEIRDGDLNKALTILDQKFARTTETFTVVNTDGTVMMIEKRPRPVAATPPPPPPRAEVQEARPAFEEREEEAPARVFPTARPGVTIQEPPPQALRPAPQPTGYRIVPRTTERLGINHIQECDQRAILPAERLEAHLFAFKNDNTAEKARQAKAMLDEYQRYLAEMVRVKRQIEDIGAEANNDSTVKDIISQIERLRARMPGNKLEEIFITEHLLVIQTTPIIAVDSTNNNRYRIGRLQFIVPLSALMSYNRHNAAIYIQNIDNILMTPDRGFMWAPHVGVGGTCFGNAGEMIVEALAKRDVISLCDVIIRFCENPNMTDHLGVVVRHFPRVEENTNV